jgi:hypothetical protein
LTAPGGTNVYGTARRGLLTRIAEPLAGRSRRRRHELFVRAMGLQGDEHILDVGCGSSGLRALDERLDITGLDRLPQPGYAGGPERFVQGDALEMPFPGKAFDVAYCNSLIEHVEPGRREQLASELRRVAGRYFVQTPNRWFPIEPHVLLPLFQFLPRGLRRRLWRFGVSGDAFHDIPLLGRRELVRLFPEATILRERVGPLTKSLMAVAPGQKEM